MNPSCLLWRNSLSSGPAVSGAGRGIGVRRDQVASCVLFYLSRFRSTVYADEFLFACVFLQYPMWVRCGMPMRDALRRMNGTYSGFYMYIRSPACVFEFVFKCLMCELPRDNEATSLISDSVLAARILCVISDLHCNFTAPLRASGALISSASRACARVGLSIGRRSGRVPKSVKRLQHPRAATSRPPESLGSLTTSSSQSPPRPRVHSIRKPSVPRFDLLVGLCSPMHDDDARQILLVGASLILLCRLWSSPRLTMLVTWSRLLRLPSSLSSRPRHRSASLASRATTAGSRLLPPPLAPCSRLVQAF